MPLPSSGWLAVGQDQPVLPHALPEIETTTYQEGGEAIVTPAVGASLEARIEGGADAGIEIGDDADDVDTLIVTMTRSEVYGIVLVDSLSAPDIVEPPVECFPTEYTEPEEPTGFACSGVVATTPSFEEIEPGLQIVLGDECLPVGVLEPVVDDWIIGDGQDIGSGILIG